MSTRQEALAALSNALIERRSFDAIDFKSVVTKYGILQSMSRRGNCYDNAPMESFFHTFKTEHVYQDDFAKLEGVREETSGARSLLRSIVQYTEC